jgi:hypothetical protein
MTIDQIKSAMKDATIHTAPAIERLLLVSMLNEAMNDLAIMHAECSMESDEKAAAVDYTDQCNRIMAAMADAGFSTPEETYCGNIALAAEHLLRSFENLLEFRDVLGKVRATLGTPEGKHITEHAKQLMAERMHAAKSATGWRVPQIGDKVRVVKLPQDEGFYETAAQVGDIYRVTGFSGLCKSKGDTDSENFHTCHPAVMCEGKEPSIFIPLCCLEPVTEPTK